MDNDLQEGIINALLQQKTITAEQVQQINTELKDGKRTLRDLLVEEKIIADEELAQLQAKIINVPYVNLKGIDIPREVLAIIPESTARKHNIIAYARTAQELQVAMSDVSDRQIVEFLRKKVDQPVIVSLASFSGIRTTLNRYQESLEDELKQVLAVAKAVTFEDDLNKAAEDLPVVRVTEILLKHAILQKASDIHIEPAETQVIIRYRIDGILKDVFMLPKEIYAGLVARIKVLSHLKIDEHRLPQDGRFKVETDDYKVAFRVSILPVYDGEKVVMRLLDESGHGLDVASLGMSPKTEKIFTDNIHKPHGMILVTGPTGSGKTTTLYAAMQEINKPEINISTIEDPIEYRMPRINQTQINPRIDLTFSNGLRSLVRQDPDVLMIGEIRDEETAALAVNAALTGHLVFSTLHTNSAAGALPRLLDMKVESFIIASTVNILVAQRLVRRLCEECRQQVKLDERFLTELDNVMNLDEVLAFLVREKIIKTGTKWSDLKVYKPKECKDCQDGYRGRIGIYEIIEFTEEIRGLIGPKTSSKDLQDAARQQQQMVTMIESGFTKVIEGITSLDELMRVAKE